MTVNFSHKSDCPAYHRLRFCNIPRKGEFDGCFYFTILWDPALSTYSFNNFHLDLDNCEPRSLSGNLALATGQRFDVLAFRENYYQITAKAQRVVEISREHGIRRIFDLASALE